MDLDKISAFVKTLGFPVAIAVWFLWKIQAFMDAMLVNQEQITNLLTQLVKMHGG
jgi:hypothetical protein